MKKIIALMTSLILLTTGQNVSAQNSVDSLKKYCTVYPGAQYILTKAYPYYSIRKMEMSEYHEDMDKSDFLPEMIAICELSNSYARYDELANDLWSLVSKQRNGENGLLTKSGRLNFIPNKTSSNSIILTSLIWDQKKNKWALLTININRIKTLFKGARMFTPKS